jgi:hypothetical protein
LHILHASGAGYPEARMSVIYDLLNRVGLDGRLEPSRLGEVDLAIEQLARAKPGDATINDRGFTGFVCLARHQKLGLHFIARCSSTSFRAAQDRFRKNQGGCSIRVKLFARPEQRAELKPLGLPAELTIRFVSLRLSTGELEVLATSLLDEVEYPTEEFLMVYHWRWNHETDYGVLKGRLDLESFSGETAEAEEWSDHSLVRFCGVFSKRTSTWSSQTIGRPCTESPRSPGRETRKKAGQDHSQPHVRAGRDTSSPPLAPSQVFLERTADGQAPVGATFIAPAQPPPSLFLFFSGAALASLSNSPPAAPLKTFGCEEDQENQSPSSLMPVERR